MNLKYKKCTVVNKHKSSDVTDANSRLLRLRGILLMLLTKNKMNYFLFGFPMNNNYCLL
jgi:hypothetical protein